jgi:hypothetical protein
MFRVQLRILPGILEIFTRISRVIQGAHIDRAQKKRTQTSVLGISRLRCWVHKHDVVSAANLVISSITKNATRTNT